MKENVCSKHFYSSKEENSEELSYQDNLYTPDIQKFHIPEPVTHISFYQIIEDWSYASHDSSAVGIHKSQQEQEQEQALLDQESTPGKKGSEHIPN